MFKFKNAFTLAETLIVMGIIGIVAALTLPNLNSSTGDKEKVSKLRKIYSNLQDAFGRAEAVYGPIGDWFVNDNSATERTKRAFERFSDFFKVTKYCDTTANINNCLISEFNTNSLGYIFADNSSASIQIFSSLSNESSFESSADAPEKKSYGYIYVDIDGIKKGKNIGGYDIFAFLITEKGIIPVGSDSYIDTDNGCVSGGGGDHIDIYCTDWVIQNGNMDYLKLKNGKCPDGKTILNSTTNTTCK